MDLNTLYHRTVESWADRVNAVAGTQWDDPTPCAEWTVRDLANHVVGEDLWTAPLMQGSTIAEVGDRFDGDLLGDDPIKTALAAAWEAKEAVAHDLPAHGTVHLSYGDERADEYVLQLAADHLVHGWDIAAATGGDTRLDPHLVAEVAAWFAEREEAYRAAGAIGPRAASYRGRPGRPAGGLRPGPALEPQPRVPGAVRRGDRPPRRRRDDGRDDRRLPLRGDRPGPGRRPPRGQRTRSASSGCSCSPAARRSSPRRTCSTPVTAPWSAGATTGPARAVGEPGHVRGVDVLRFRDGKISEKLSYVKG